MARFGEGVTTLVRGPVSNAAKLLRRPSFFETLPLIVFCFFALLRGVCLNPSLGLCHGWVQTILPSASFLPLAAELVDARFDNGWSTEVLVTGGEPSPPPRPPYRPCGGPLLGVISSSIGNCLTGPSFLRSAHRVTDKISVRLGQEDSGRGDQWAAGSHGRPAPLPRHHP